MNSSTCCGKHSTLAENHRGSDRQRASCWESATIPASKAHTGFLVLSRTSSHSSVPPSSANDKKANKDNITQKKCPLQVTPPFLNHSASKMSFVAITEIIFWSGKLHSCLLQEWRAFARSHKENVLVLPTQCFRRAAENSVRTGRDEVEGKSQEWCRRSFCIQPDFFNFQVFLRIWSWKDCFCGLKVFEIFETCWEDAPLELTIRIRPWQLVENQHCVTALGVASRC